MPTTTAAPEDALEPALRALVEESGAAAGAVCLWQAREGVLRLAAEVGLSDDGCRLLRTLQPDTGDFDLPLESLHERQLKIVESRTGDELPPLVESPGETAAVACVPLGPTECPLGIVLLVAGAPAILTEDRLLGAQALYAVDAIVDAIHRQRTSTPVDTETPGGSTFDALVDATLHRIESVARDIARVLDLAGWRPVADRLAGAGRVLRRLGGLEPAESAHVRELESAAETLRAECRRLRVDAEQRVVAIAHEWQERLAEAQAAYERERQRGDSFEREHEHRTLELADALARERRLREELEARLARNLADREEILSRAREMQTAAEALRASATGEADAARAALTAAEVSIINLREELSRARDEASQLGVAEQTARAARVQLQHALEETRTRADAADDHARALEAEVGVLRARGERIEQEARERQAQGESRWRTKLAEFETAAAAAFDRAQTAEREVARLVADRDRALEAQAQAEEQLASVLEQATAAREATLREARELAQRAEDARALAVTELEAVRGALADAQLVIFNLEAVQEIEERGAVDRAAALDDAVTERRLTEEARVTTVAELERVRAELATAQAAVLGAQDEARHARNALERLHAVEENAKAERERLSAASAAMREREAELSAQIDDLQEQLRALREDGRTRDAAAEERVLKAEQRWSAALNDAEARYLREHERVVALEREHERRASELEEVTGRERRARQELTAALERAATDREETMRHARELAHATERARAAAVAETEAIRGAMANAQRLIFESEAETRRVQAEAERLRDTEQAAGAEQERLKVVLDGALARERELAERVSRLEHELAGVQAAAAKGGRVAVAKPPASTRKAPVTAPALEEPMGVDRRVVVLDRDESWAGVGDADVEVVAVTPTTDTGERVHDLAPKRLLANLASPGVFEVMTGLRAAGSRRRFWSCLGTSGATQPVMLLGPVEPVTRPVNTDALLTTLLEYVAPGARVLMAGSDVNVALSVRQALVRAGMSVSIAWDVQQASDLLGIVRPQVVILDLELPPRGAHGVLVGLAKSDPIPIVMLIPGEGDPAVGFSAAFAAHGNAADLVSRADAVRKVAGRGARMQVRGR